MNDSGYNEPELPSWVRIPAGILLLGISLLCLVGVAYMVYAPAGSNLPVTLIIGTLILVFSVWAVIRSMRLVAGRRIAGGELLSPSSLRLGGALFLALPVFGLFTGAYSSPGIRPLRVVQAVVYVFFALAVFRLAGRRAHQLRGGRNGRGA